MDIVLYKHRDIWRKKFKKHELFQLMLIIDIKLKNLAMYENLKGITDNTFFLGYPYSL